MAGQKYWKKVKGEWVNTLALERAKRKELQDIKPKEKSTKETTGKPNLKGGGMAGMRRFNRGGKV